MSTKFFHAVTHSGKVESGTVGALADWLEQYANVLFPNNSIEYWAATDNIKREAILPVVSSKETGIHHVACYPRTGSSEGRILEVGLYLRNSTIQSVGWAKTFGGADETWMIARAISDALEEIFYWGNIPEIVDMANKMPRKYSWDRKTSLQENVIMQVSEDAIKVSTPSGLVLDDRNWSEHGKAAKHYVEARANDWTTVLTNLNVHFIKQETRENINITPIGSHDTTYRGKEALHPEGQLP